VAPSGLVQLGDALGEPFLLAPCGLGIIAALDADAQRVSQLDAGLQQIGGLGVDLRVLLVPQDVAVFLVEEDDALRHGLDRLAQPLFG
jgi:hypothetical protein